MREPVFTLTIDGKDAEDKAKELAEYIGNQFGSQPEVSQQRPPVTRGKGADLLVLGTFILTIPAAILSVMDLVDRIKKKKKLDKLIEIAANQPGQVSITTPDGTVIKLNTPGQGSGAILDAAARIKDAQ